MSVRISFDGVDTSLAITKATLNMVSGMLIFSGLYEYKFNHDISAGAILILLGGFILIIREYCKSLSNNCKKTENNKK